MKVSYLIVGDSITVSFDGKCITIKESDHRYNNLLSALKDNRLSDVPRLVDVSSIFDDTADLELVNGYIEIRGRRVPEVLNDRILAFKRDGFPFGPLVKFAEKIMKNPSLNSRNMLYKFLEHNGHPITADGNFIAYKKVRTNFKDCHTNTFDNSLGNVVEMPREDVDDNPTNTCSDGLHVASYDYAKRFSIGHLLEVEIDPSDVVAVPNDYNGEKMRVCKYVVRDICASKLETEFYDEDEYDYEEHINFCSDDIPF